jgi:HD-GYP domain-containing protein (c-di-GMP phosphodiesterase class II)
MTSDRPYRRALAFDQARAEILRCSGSQFDPAIVQIFLRMPESLWHNLRREVAQSTSGPFGVAV